MPPIIIALRGPHARPVGGGPYARASSGQRSTENRVHGAAPSPLPPPLIVVVGLLLLPAFQTHRPAGARPLARRRLEAPPRPLHLRVTSATRAAGGCETGGVRSLVAAAALCAPASCCARAGLGLGILAYIHPDQPSATTSGAPASVYPEWPSFQAYSAIPPHGFFPPTVAANPQAHPYMWGAQHMVPPYGTPPSPYVVYPPGTVYAHPSTPPGMHPFSHYPMPTNGHAETPGAAPSAPEMNGKNEPGRMSAPSANGITSHSESGSESESEGSDANSQNDSQSKDNDGKEDGSSQNGISYSVSQGMLNQTMPMVTIQPGAMVGVPGSTANLNIGMDYWAAPGSATVPATQGKATSGSARGDQWDERELKKQKRKQSNRESARRSRLRKQAECEELGQRAEALRSENSSLRAELERIRKEYEQLLSQNASLKEKLGATSDSIPDMNEQNDGGGSGYKKQPDSDAQPGNES